MKRPGHFIYEKGRLLVVMKRVLIVCLLILVRLNSSAQKIHKFDRISVVDGLSHNYVQSILCDDKGFLWFGTWDGLNRYDGRQFKIFKVNPNRKNTLTNNRIIDLWQDKQHVMWVKTNDGYVHYFDDKTYDFMTFPYYSKSLEERNSTISCFTETDNHEIFLGSTNSGLYYLKFNDQTKKYDTRQFLSRGEASISDNAISFILNDHEDDFWIGTKHGLNHISQAGLDEENPRFSHPWTNHAFTSGIAVDTLLLFGTEDSGIKAFLTTNQKPNVSPEMFRALSRKSITLIHHPFKNKLLVGTSASGLYVYDLKAQKIQAHFLDGKRIKKVYKDSYQTIWVNTQEFGIYKIDSTFSSIRHYELVPQNIKRLVDDERQNIYEDSKRNLWIALHGGGLAHFNRQSQEFEFYRNMPNDNTTISSDNVYCITEDQSGILWVGTGATNGGVNKISTTNEAFQRIRLEENINSGNENVVRALLIDGNKNTWAGTKAGNIYILDQDYHIFKKFHQIPLERGLHPGQNAYSMIQDTDGYIWIGTKGGGLFVSSQPLKNIHGDYDQLRFINYVHDPSDSSSISSNIIYSIFEDSDRRIWIGSYEGGLNLVLSRKHDALQCLHFNTSNTQLSSDKVRNLSEDHDKKLWIATDFGINYLDLRQLDLKHPKISPHLYDPRRRNSLSYNDVIHAFEDSNNQLWLGTSGGGVNKLLANHKDSLVFEHINTQTGLINDVVYAILEDHAGGIWFSTDHGISRYNPKDSTFENFDQSNNLNTDVFNENTCGITKDGKLWFGTNDGLLVIRPDKIERNDFSPNVVFTNFQLFNKDIDIKDPDSPIKQDIETLDHIDLKYFQSSFSIEYAALSYFAPTKNKYAFKLEHFDHDWNEVGNQDKATYTNLSPGKYIFKVRAANWNSDWSNKTRSIVITIHPPWWKTNMMYLVYLLIFVAIVEIIRRSYTRYHKLQNDLEVEKRVNDIKLRFFTNISHEIRTPLTLILGPIHDILDIRDIPKSVSSKLHLVEKNGKRMLRLVNQLLDFRKIQKKKMTLQVHKVELNSFIESIIENFNLIAEQKHIDILFEANWPSQEVWVDPNKFDSVIFNILSNALKFSPKEGKIMVRVNSGNDGFVDLSITDQGSGIPKNKIPQIFERFSPLTEENEEFGNSGIGLAYSYEIMQLHHGDIMVSSEPDKGSKFTVRILLGNRHFTAEDIQFDEAESLYKVNHKQVIPDETSATHDIPENEKEFHILIVEDNYQILHYLKDNLTDEYKISLSPNGREAIKFVDKNQPDLIITDLMMPEMDGIEMTQKLKDAIETSHIPIIMLTAKSAMEDQIEGIESGAEAYILKPFNMVYVRAVINNLLKQRKIIVTKYVQNKDTGISGIKITTKDEKFLNDIDEIVRENYSDPEFNIEKLVENFYVSRTVFYHKIKGLTGLTPIEFLRQKRLQIASQLIVETDYNISEIAILTGFNDLKNFSRRFKEIYKMTPSKYKR